MGWEALFCLGVLIAVFAGLINNRAPDALLLGAVVLVSIAGIISPEEALVGFSNAVMLTVGVLYVVAAALRETGALDAVGSCVLGNAKSERGCLCANGRLRYGNVSLFELPVENGIFPRRNAAFPVKNEAIVVRNARERQFVSAKVVALWLDL
jgi:hypothetical protein